jgi:hypothetical protein
VPRRMSSPGISWHLMPVLSNRAWLEAIPANRELTANRCQSMPGAASRPCNKRCNISREVIVYLASRSSRDRRNAPRSRAM